MGFETPPAVEDQNLSSPVRVPISFRIEIENVGCKLAGCITVRRHRATVPGIIPLKGRNELPWTQHATQEALIGIAVQFCDEFFPGLSQFHAWAMVQQASVMRGLPIGAFNADLPFE